MVGSQRISCSFSAYAHPRIRDGHRWTTACAVVLLADFIANTKCFRSHFKMFSDFCRTKASKEARKPHLVWDHSNSNGSRSTHRGWTIRTHTPCTAILECQFVTCDHILIVEATRMCVQSLGAEPQFFQGRILYISFTLLEDPLTMVTATMIRNKCWLKSGIPIWLDSRIVQLIHFHVQMCKSSDCPFPAERHSLCILDHCFDNCRRFHDHWCATGLETRAGWCYSKIIVSHLKNTSKAICTWVKQKTKQPKRLSLMAASKKNTFQYLYIFQSSIAALTDPNFKEPAKICKACINAYRIHLPTSLPWRLVLYFCLCGLHCWRFSWKSGAYATVTRPAF